MAISERGEADRRLDQAARAAWLYYVKSKRQDDIAQELGISRQVVQRLIALALSENLISFQVRHPLSECIALADRLKEKFGLQFCEVALNEAGNTEDIPAVATVAAHYLDNVLMQKAPVTIAVGNGTAMRETVMRISSADRPQHRCVSLMGNLTPNGRASRHDVVTKLAERINAQSYPLPMPLVAATVSEREILQAQLGYKTLRGLVDDANLLVMGSGNVGWQAGIHADGFITDPELAEAMDAGAVGEVLGGVIDKAGRFVEVSYIERLTSLMRAPNSRQPTLLVSSGQIRVPAIYAALTGKLANMLITDENTAKSILAVK
ncbi:sugar-binding transcriptional regulator [Mesorhizobium sp. RP14(2022)]|jgi:DNA-binding transcriptional regulator LsrR (DeoR family)|uniref:Sugar-binding transcriptional regulator n=1 Tax=Mesorhizobium liriopis TaxID=2953882 RepID=A0ABT1C342_9HYPH|nr:sugar-binding domain-containing protein [Mesorhizobium liriopis]MCO6049248.1 sugar-binding transcriptional regulator [Mesorhizobium liriopis]